MDLPMTRLAFLLLLVSTLIALGACAGGPAEPDAGYFPPYERGIDADIGAVLGGSGPTIGDLGQQQIKALQLDEPQAIRP